MSIRIPLRIDNAVVDRSSVPPYKGHDEADCFGSQRTKDWINTWISVHISGFEPGLMWVWTDSSYGLRSKSLPWLTDLHKVQGWQQAVDVVVNVVTGGVCFFVLFNNFVLFWGFLYTWTNKVIYLHGYWVLFLLDNCYYLALARAVPALCVCVCLTGMTGEMLSEICLQDRVPKAVEVFDLPYNSFSLSHTGQETTLRTLVGSSQYVKICIPNQMSNICWR